jgi:hypothetical protein
MAKATKSKKFKVEIEYEAESTLTEEKKTWKEFKQNFSTADKVDAKVTEVK